MTRLKPFYDPEGEVTHWIFWCPGCEEYHSLTADEFAVENSFGRPTVVPDFQVFDHAGKLACSLKIRHGMIHYSCDCRHELGGQICTMQAF